MGLSTPKILPAVTTVSQTKFGALAAEFVSGRVSRFPYLARMAARPATIITIPFGGGWQALGLSSQQAARLGRPVVYTLDRRPGQEEPELLLFAEHSGELIASWPWDQPAQHFYELQEDGSRIYWLRLADPAAGEFSKFTIALALAREKAPFVGLCFQGAELIDVWGPRRRSLPWIAGRPISAQDKTPLIIGSHIPIGEPWRLTGLFNVFAVIGSRGERRVNLDNIKIYLEEAEAQQLGIGPDRLGLTARFEEGLPVALLPEGESRISQAVPLCLKRDSRWQLVSIVGRDLNLPDDRIVFIVEGRPTIRKANRRIGAVRVNGVEAALPGLAEGEAIPARVSLVMRGGKIVYWRPRASFKRRARARIDQIIAREQQQAGLEESARQLLAGWEEVHAQYRRIPDGKLSVFLQAAGILAGRLRPGEDKDKVDALIGRVKTLLARHRRGSRYDPEKILTEVRARETEPAASDDLPLFF